MNPINDGDLDPEEETLDEGGPEDVDDWRDHDYAPALGEDHPSYCRCYACDVRSGRIED